MNHTAQGYEATGLNPNYQPHTATEFLDKASETLGERGKQYDPAGKQERSMTAVVAAFNAIYPRSPLTVHMGWQFMSLVKMVRGATKPHADSALDQVAYAALAAEEVASQLNQPAALCEDEGCPHHGMPHVCLTSVETPEQHTADIAKVMEMEARPSKSYVDPMIGGQTDYERWQGAEAALRSMRTSKNTYKSSADLAAKKVEELLVHSRRLEVEMDILRASLAAYACRFDLSKEYMTKEQVLAGQAKHEAQVEKLRERECLDIETINDLRTELASCKAMTAKFQAERKANVAMHEEVTRLRGKVQDLADLAEYRDKRNAELCAELSRAQDEIQSLLAEKRNLTARNKELEDKVQSLNNEVEAKVRELMSNMRHEAPCAHNTDEPKAPRPEYVDPFDQYGDIRSPMHRLVGDRDPARGGLAHPQGKDAPTPQ